MELAPVAQLTFEVTYDSDELNVGMSIYDTTGLPVLVSGPTAMAVLAGNTYFGKFTPTEDHAYVIIKKVYTDDSLDTVDTDYSPGTESIICKAVGGGGGGGQPSTGAVIGIVEENQTLIGIVESDTLIGIIDC